MGSLVNSRTERRVVTAFRNSCGSMLGKVSSVMVSSWQFWMACSIARLFLAGDLKFERAGFARISARAVSVEHLAAGLIQRLVDIVEGLAFQGDGNSEHG